LWDVSETQIKEVATLQNKYPGLGGVRSHAYSGLVAFSPDGRTLLSLYNVRDYFAKAWKVDTKALIFDAAKNNPDFLPNLTTVAFVPDQTGLTLLAGYSNDTLKVWSLPRGN
jgi:WD40 repeat protein